MTLTTPKGMSPYQSLNLLHDCPLLRTRHEISEAFCWNTFASKAVRNTVCICRLALEPRQQACMHSTEAARVDEVNIRPFGYQWSVPISIPKLYQSQEPRSYAIPSSTRCICNFTSVELFAVKQLRIYIEV